MRKALLCDGLRTPFGRYGGALSAMRPDDLAAAAIGSLLERHPAVDWAALDDVILGCANQAGEDNRNVARMALLLAGLPETVPGTTVNRLCGSSMEAAVNAARAIRCGDADLVIAGGVESMSRAPFVMPKAAAPFSRGAEIFDTTIGWRFINQEMKRRYGVDSMPETAENVAAEFNIGRHDQDAFALRSQQRWRRAAEAGFFRCELAPVDAPQPKGGSQLLALDEPPRPDSTLEGLGRLRPVVKPEGTVTAGNSSGITDGATALLLASEEGVRRWALRPRAVVLASAAVGIAPRIMGFAPAPAVRKVLEKAGLTLAQMDVVEVNEAFAAQVLAVTRELGLPDDAGHVNANGGAIAIGHPLGASGARLLATALYQLERTGGRYAVCAMCIGVGQGIAMVLERC